MPRAARLVDPEGTYHIIANGNARSAIFHDDTDRLQFLALLRSETRTRSIDLYHYALMDTHVHLVIRAHSAHPLWKVMKRLLLGFTQHHARRYGHRGHLWRGRFKSFTIASDRYLLTCGIYVELNPVRAGMATSASKALWTSHAAYTRKTSLPHITPSPAFLALGKMEDERHVAYAALTKMWTVHPVGKKEAKKFFKNGAKMGQSPFIQKGTVPF